MPSLERFEYLTYSHQHIQALIELFDILTVLYETGGKPGTALSANLTALLEGEDQDTHIVSRFVAAYASLLSYSDLTVSEADFQRLIIHHPTISGLFASTPFRNADYVMPALRLEEETEVSSFLKYCLLLTSESELPFNPAALWRRNKKAAAGLFMAILCHTLMARPAAHAKRELLLAWLPAHLEEIGDLNALPYQFLIGVYMMCSYADLPSKHDIKKPLNRLIRQTLLTNGLSDITPLSLVERGLRVEGTSGIKPIMFVVLEWFFSRHSIYRTHSTTLRACKEAFYLVGIGYADNTDEIGRAVFDEFHLLNAQDDLAKQIGFIHTLSQKLRPDVVYYPSIGMMHLTVFLSNLRLAPLQLMALGHPATTHSPCIDSVLVESDYLGDPACFSEHVTILPKDSLPYVPPAPLGDIKPRTPASKREIKPGATIRVGVVASMIKLNPRFLSACQSIARRAQHKVEFHFYDGGSDGFGLFHLRCVIRDFLPDAVIRNRLGYEEFMAALNECDLFVNPFPFGNTNGLVDTFRLALPGVCMTGSEVHSHIDEGLMRRVALPDWLITHNVEAYIAAAVRLVDDNEIRIALSEHLLEVDIERILFSGRPEQFMAAVQVLLAEKKKAEK